MLNSITMNLFIPKEKLREVEITMKLFVTSQKVKKCKILSLAGKLNWITQWIYGGRFHMHRLIDRYNTLRKPGIEPILH